MDLVKVKDDILTDPGPFCLVQLYVNVVEHLTNCLCIPIYCSFAEKDSAGPQLLLLIDSQVKA